MKVWLGVKDKPKLDHGHWVLRMTVLAKTTRLHAEKIGLRAEQSYNPGPRSRRGTAGTAFVPVAQQAAPDRAPMWPCPRGGCQGWEPRTRVLRLVCPTDRPESPSGLATTQCGHSLWVCSLPVPAASQLPGLEGRHSGGFPTRNDTFPSCCA